MSSADPTVMAAIVGAIVGSVLIILNEWVKVLFARKKQKEKLAIWNVLESKGSSTASAMSLGAIIAQTQMSQNKVESLIYEMIREGTIYEGPLPGGFTRSKDYKSANGSFVSINMP